MNLKNMVCLLAMLMLVHNVRAANITGYIREVPVESRCTREARHDKIAGVRSRPIVLCHRGASAFAPDNTLEAFAAALAYGADGCEVDLQYTADDVLVCFHDITVERLTNGFGRFTQFTYPQILSFGLRSYGTATPKTNVPTFAALVEFARKTNMLIFLDIKVREEDIPKLEREIIRNLDEADAWDHVVGFDGIPTDLPKHPSYKWLPGIKWLFDEHRIDWDPDQVKKTIPPPGQMIMVDDPRVCASVMGRRPRKPVMPPESCYKEWSLSSPQDPSTRGMPAYAVSLDISPNSVSDLLKLLKTDLSTREDITGDEAYQSKRAEHIWARAWAAHRLGQLGHKDSRVICWLEYEIRNRSRHCDSVIYGSDGVAAVNALGSLRATKSVPMLVDTYNKIESERKKLKTTVSDEPAPKAWDIRLQVAIIRTLGKMPCEAAKHFLKEHLKPVSQTTGQWTDYMEDAIAKSLCSQTLSRREIEGLLTNGSPELRANLIQECLDNPTPERRAALKAKAPWALRLPRAR